MGEIKSVSVGSLQKGRYCIIEGAACVVSDVKVSRPGKHGHAKVNLTAVGMIDGKKRNTVMPGHDHIDVPVIEKKNAQVLSVAGDHANVMDMDTYETFDLKIPVELQGQVKGEQVVVYWTILDDKVLKQIKPSE
ncbi:MAG: translation initiation factor IF-5A [Candidatus Woesearchaeota archaeon]|nr:MAG: translation initiation factor IF-5A [Candidatus Woesearchaeota archaeon]